MTAKNVLVILALTGMFVLSVQYPAYYEKKDISERMTLLRDFLDQVIVDQYMS